MGLLYKWKPILYYLCLLSFPVAICIFVPLCAIYWIKRTLRIHFSHNHPQFAFGFKCEAEKWSPCVVSVQVEMIKIHSQQQIHDIGQLKKGKLFKSWACLVLQSSIQCLATTVFVTGYDNTPVFFTHLPNTPGTCQSFCDHSSAFVCSRICSWKMLHLCQRAD